MEFSYQCAEKCENVFHVHVTSRPYVGKKESYHGLGFVGFFPNNNKTPKHWWPKKKKEILTKQQKNSIPP